MNCQSNDPIKFITRPTHSSTGLGLYVFVLSSLTRPEEKSNFVASLKPHRQATVSVVRRVTRLKKSAFVFVISESPIGNLTRLKKEKKFKPWKAEEHSSTTLVFSNTKVSTAHKSFGCTKYKEEQ